jgi:hypothetical protein
MIEKIVKDYKTHTFNSFEEIKEKLDYFREISRNGLDKLSDEEFDKLHTEFNRFFNLNLAIFADKYPTKLFRITNNKYLLNGKKQKLQEITQLIGPPPGLANYGRCNMPEESVFYAALDFQTAIWETQPQPGDYITVSEWKIKDGQKIDTHTIFHPQKTNLAKDSQTAYEAYLETLKGAYPQFKEKNPEIEKVFEEILMFLTEEYMKVVPNDKKRNYLFSAQYSSRLLQTGRDGNGFQIEAISYPSVKMNLGLTNIAILNSLALEKLDLVSIILMEVAETKYTSKDVYIKDLIKVSGIQYKVTEFDFDNNKIIYNPKEELRLAIEMHEKYLAGKEKKKTEANKG